MNNQGKFQAKAEEIDRRVFTGGPLRDFEKAGREQLIALLRCGVYPDSKVLDVGCGALRGGYWLISFLKKNCYCGIEPNADMLETGRDVLLDREMLKQKAPRFDTNERFDFSVFNENFDFVIARSIWSHASKEQITHMLDSFVENSFQNSVFLASYLKSNIIFRDYKGKNWKGKSHQSDERGLVRHNKRWIEKECLSRGMVVKEIGLEKLNGQRWLYITKK